MPDVSRLLEVEPTHERAVLTPLIRFAWPLFTTTGMNPLHTYPLLPINTLARSRRRPESW